MEKWKDYRFVSSSTTTDEFRNFSRDMRKHLKNKMKGYNLASYSRGHFEFSAFFEKDGKYIYISSSDVRFFNNEWYNHLLVRTAESDKDFTGGDNTFSTLENIKESADRLIR